MEQATSKTSGRRQNTTGWLRGQRLPFQLAMVLLIVYLVTAIVGPLLTPYSYNEMLAGRPFERPSPQHLLGTDNLGRDVFSRVVHGARIDLGLGVSAASLAIVLGSLIGLLIGYKQGWVDLVVMRVTEIVISIPPLILALLILSAIGSSPGWIVLLTAFLFIPRVATVVRAATLDVVSEDYVTSAKLRGESALSIAIRELLPNVMACILVEFSLRTGYAVLFIGGLGFLGFGVAPPTPEWGLMINEGRQFISSAMWTVVAPSLAIAFLVIALSLFTEGLSEKLGLTVKRGF